MPSPVKSLSNWFLGVVAQTRAISLDLFKIMIPVILLVKAFEMMGMSAYLAAVIAPLMSAIGLPPEMGVVWAGTMLSNIYTGMILFVSEPASTSLSVSQVTVLGILMLVAHSLPVELRVTQKIGVPILLGFLLRLVAAYIAAWIYYKLMLFFPAQQQLADIVWEPVIQQNSLGQWALSQVKLLLQIVLIIAVLVVLLQAIRRMKLDRLLHIVLGPILPLLGMSEKAVNVVLVGMTLGLTYGGGLLIQESKLGLLKARELFFSVCLLLLCHGLIEDTMLILLLGADIYGILVFRLVFSIVLVAVMVRALAGKPDDFFSQRLLNRHYQASKS